MKSAAKGLRNWIVPLLALAGVAALVAGTVGWWRFYRGLYAEEIAAIHAAVEASGRVVYRREGESRPRVAATESYALTSVRESEAWDRERERTPWNAPFVGRVESCRVSSPTLTLWTGGQAFSPSVYSSGMPGGSVPGAGSSTLGLSPEVRDGLLRLPGLRTYHEFPGGRTRTTSPSVESGLGRPLPALPEPILKGPVLSALPQGEPLDDDARAELGERIAQAWSNAQPLDSYLLRVEVAGVEGQKALAVTELVDGDRRVSLQERTFMLHIPNDSHTLALVDGDETHLLKEENGAWRTTARLDDATSTEEDRISSAPSLPAPGYVPALFDETDTQPHRFGSLQESLALIGERGERIVVAEKLDDVRFRLDLASTTTKVAGADVTQRFEAIVRSDLDYAVERFALRTETERTETSPATSYTSEVSRLLMREGGVVFARETRNVQSWVMWTNLNFVETQQPKSSHVAVYRATLVRDPRVPESAFDAAAYDPTVWPRPRALPIVRPYWFGWGIGAALLIAAGVGSLATRRTGESRAATRGFRLRFGLASLFASALLAISAAGAIKAKRDVAERDAALVRSLPGTVELERREPRFPWLFFSTPACPLDAPIVRMEIDAQYGEAAGEVKEEALHELLRNPELERLASSPQRDGQDATYADAIAAAQVALAREMPKLPNVDDSTERRWLDRMAEGQVVEGAERDELLARIATSWIDSRKNFPRRWLLVEGCDAAEPMRAVTLRDGDRSWSLASVTSQGDEFFAVRCEDERYRYGFSLQGEKVLTTERTLRDDESAPIDGVWEFSPIDLNRWFTWPTRRPPAAPFAFPRALYEESPAFGAAAEAALVPANALRVARIDDRRVRIDFPSAVAAPWGNAGDAVTLDALAVVVREDLDDAVEQVAFQQTIVTSPTATKPTLSRQTVSSRPTVSSLPPLPPEDTKRAIYVFNDLERQAGVVVPAQTIVGMDEGTGRVRWTHRFAYDFDPAIDERIFRSPGMDRLEPLPAPVEASSFGWPHATALLACGIFAFGLFGRVRARLRPGARREEERV